MSLRDLFGGLNGPVFIKDDSDAEKELEYLKSLPSTLEIEREIKLVKAGIAGERNIKFELENGHIPCYVLHDVYLEHGDQSAQIDYLIICHKCNYVVECKNLYGNIEIDSQGNFTRVFNFGKQYKKEGFYSPVTQNERHIALIKQIIKDRGVLMKLFLSDGEDGIWKSVIVLANPKTYLNNKYAPEEIKKKVIRADQLVNFIKKTEAASKELALSDSEMKAAAERWLERCKPNPVDYTSRFKPEELVTQNPAITHENLSESEAKITTEIDTDDSEPAAPICKRCGVPMVKRVAKKGKNAGSEFWGCPNYPHCRYIIPIEK